MMENEESMPMTQSSTLHGSTITFTSINYSICTSVSCRTESKEILHQLHGIFKPGVNAILGPTGSGKSSLLDILAGRKARESFTGEVKIDGEIPTEDDKYRVGYVVQNDMVSGMLTVRENLIFSANVRLPRHVTADEKRATVNRVIQQLGLEKCAESRVGTEETRGISGGERRRTNIGMDLVLSPTVLFLDEPTTGLDSSTAQNVIECLDELSKRGHTIILSIHQPRYSIFKRFVTLYLLVAGHCVYHGPADEVLNYFSSIGFTCEEHDNPADFILDIGQGLRWTSYAPIGDENDPEKRNERIALYLRDHYHQSTIFKRIEEEMERQSKEIFPRKHHFQSRSIFGEMFYVSQRTLRTSFRNPALMVMQTIVPVCLAFFVGSLYFNTDRTLENGIKNRLGAIFFIVSNQVFLNLSALELFIKERTLYTHEYASGYYRISSYFISKVLCDILPLRSIPSILFSFIAYFMIQFQRTVEKFFIFLFTIFLTAVCASSICFFISASVESFGVANLVSAAFCVTMLVFTGYLVDVATALPFLRWIKWISLFRYASDSLTLNEFKNLTLCLKNQTKICAVQGESILREQNIDYQTNWDLWKNFLALISMSLCFFALTFLQLLRYKTRS